MRPLALFCCAATLTATAPPPPVPSEYAMLFDLDTSGEESPAWRFDLTPEVYRWSQDARVHDLAVFNGAGAPVSFAPVAVDPVVTERLREAALPTFELPTGPTGQTDLSVLIERDAQGRLRRLETRKARRAAGPAPTTMWLVDVSAFGRPLQRVELSWSGETDVVARFAVEASNDLERWRDVARGAVVRLHQGDARIERRDLALPNVGEPYLRLRRLDDGAPLKGLAVRGSARERSRELPERAWLPAAPVTNLDGGVAPQGVSSYFYALPGAVPADSAKLELVHDNAVANLELFGRADAQAPWQRLGALNAFRLRLDDALLTQGETWLGLRGRLREFRVDARVPLAAAPQLSLGFLPQRFVFLAEGPGPYVLAAGRRHARYPPYPVDMALAMLRARRGADWWPPDAALGEGRASAGEAALRDPIHQVNWQRVMLWGVLVLGALVVAGFAVSLLRGPKSPS